MTVGSTSYSPVVDFQSTLDARYNQGAEPYQSIGGDSCRTLSGHGGLQTRIVAVAAGATDTALTLPSVIALDARSLNGQPFGLRLRTGETLLANGVQHTFVADDESDELLAAGDLSFVGNGTAESVVQVSYIETP